MSNEDRGCVCEWILNEKKELTNSFHSFVNLRVICFSFWLKFNTKFLSLSSSHSLTHNFLMSNGFKTFISFNFLLHFFCCNCPQDMEKNEMRNRKYYDYFNFKLQKQDNNHCKESKTELKNKKTRFYFQYIRRVHWTQYSKFIDTHSIQKKIQQQYFVDVRKKVELE